MTQTDSHTTVMIHKGLSHAPRDMSLAEMKAFNFSLYSLQKSEDPSKVEVDLSEFLAIDGVPKSYTKESVSKAFKSLTDPCINLAQKGESERWVPAYKNAEWKGDIMLIHFNPEIEKLVKRDIASGAVGLLKDTLAE